MKITLLKLSLCHYSDTQILLKEAISVANTAAVDANAINTIKKVILKNCAPFADYIIKINNTEVKSAKILMH